MSSRRAVPVVVSPPVRGTNSRRFLNQVDPSLPDPPAGACLTDNKLRRIWTLRRHYALQVAAGVRQGLSPIDLARTQFPFSLPVAPRPPGVHVELTNRCNLSCTYCTSPQAPRPRGLMNAETFESLIGRLREARIRRVYVVGLGEPMLHPRFDDFVPELAAATRFVSVTSNLQAATEENLAVLVDSGVGMLNVSVDGFDATSYEESRVGGDFEVVRDNLTRLKLLRDRSNSDLLINVRVMLRPSQADREDEILEAWSSFGDEVSRQFIVNISGSDDDVYAVDVAPSVYPRCSIPFKQLEVHWTGDVPLCTYVHHQADRYEDFVLGNVADRSIDELWNSPLLHTYRQGHRKRDSSLIPLCSGCGGC
ncbi:MAG: radical SAM/SPASM domain-containing protein [Actinomycetota bacterium]